MASCAPQGTGGTSTAQQQFCEFWDKVEAAPPAADNAVLVKDDVVALADDASVTGTSCTDSAARVELDGAVLAEGEEVLAEQGTASTETVAAVTGDEIGADEPVLDNLKIQALSAEIGVNGITVRGNVAVRLSGKTSTIGFVGNLQNLDNWSVNLSSSGLTLPGIVSSPVVFSGTLASINGVPSLSLTASATSAKIGDVTINGAAIRFFASPAAGVSATVQGAIKIGPSTVNGRVDVDFDKAGSLVQAKADIAARLVGTQADGKKIDLTGSVKLEGNATETVASFAAAGNVGDFRVIEANGTLALATNKATMTGVFDVEQGANYLRFNGSIVWDGITAYTPYFALEGAGEISGTLNDGQAVSVAGNLTAESIGGQLRSVVNGTFKIGTLKATGRAIVETNGATTTLEVEGTLVDAGFAAAIDGAVIITDGLAELVELNAVVTGAVNLGDITLTGASLAIRSTYGSPLDVAFSGGLKVGTRANLNGSVNASFGPGGKLLSLVGSVNGSLALDSWAIVNFGGSVIATQEQVTLSGEGGVILTNFPLGITFRGSLTSSLTNPSWSLTGSGRLRLASIDVASARLTLSQGVGMKATRVGFYFSIIGIPTYFEGDFYMNSGGGCSKVNITSGSFLAKPILKLVLPGVIGCPVY